MQLTILLAGTLLCPALANAEPTYQAVRLNNEQPLISAQTFADAGINGGGNINGPSVIRVPDWITPEERPDPKANYYMYFANHGGDYIRMAWAQTVDGPYTLYNTSGSPLGVLDLGSGINLANDITIRDHIASPDVHVNDDEQRIELYFHGGVVKHGGGNIAGNRQQTFVSFSNTGLDFNAGIVPAAIGWAYLRVFDYNGEKYGIGSRGSLFKAPDDPFAIPANHDFKQLLWDFEGQNYDFTDNPFQDDVDADPDGPTRLRHVAVRVTNDTLEVFHTRVGDSPERILLSTIDLSTGDFDTWDPTYPPEEILRPELDWEGADQPLSASGSGAGVNKHELRDPYVFEDTDGKLYLFYTGEGEEAIGIARLDPVPEPSSLALLTAVGGLLLASRRMRKRA